MTGIEPHAIARLGIGIKTQVPNVFNGLSVRENIAVAAFRRKSMAASRPDRRRDPGEAGPDAHRAPSGGQLAHGQRQWVEIGTVLAQEPELILLDEPAAGMTHEEVVRTSALIREINRAQAMIVVEHDMQFIRMIANTVTVFDQGAILLEDDVEQVLASPAVRDVYLGKRAAA